MVVPIGSGPEEGMICMPGMPVMGPESWHVGEITKSTFVLDADIAGTATAMATAGMLQAATASTDLRSSVFLLVDSVFTLPPRPLLSDVQREHISPR